MKMNNGLQLILLLALMGTITWIAFDIDKSLAKKEKRIFIEAQETGKNEYRNQMLRHIEVSDSILTSIDSKYEEYRMKYSDLK